MDIEPIKKIVSDKQETISKLTERLAKSELDLAEKERRISDAVQLEVISFSVHHHTCPHLAVY